MARKRKEGRKDVGIYNKGGKLYIVISKPVIKNGNKKYTNEWFNTGFDDTAENVQKAINLRNHFISNKKNHDVDKNISTKDFLEKYLQEKKRIASDTTYASYIYYSKLIDEYFKNIKIKDISEDYINEFFDYLFVDRNLSTRTVKNTKTAFYNVMEYAIKTNVIIRNPVKDTTLNKRLSEEHRTYKDEDEEFFSYEEVMAFLQEATKHRQYALFHTTIFFGLRRSEVLGLKWDALDLEKGILKIKHKVTRGTKVNRVDGTKTEESRQEYPLSASQIEMFKQLKQKESEYRKLFGKNYIDNNYIFKNEDGKPYYPDYPTKAFNKIKKRCTTLPQGVTFHGLRKSCASILVHEGFDIKTIQKWMRHTDINTTLAIYAKVKEKEAKKEIAEKMIDMLPVETNN